MNIIIYNIHLIYTLGWNIRFIGQLQLLHNKYKGIILPFHNTYLYIILPKGLFSFLQGKAEYKNS